MPRRNSTRSTSPCASAVNTTASVIVLRYHNVYGPRMPADTPYSGVAAIFRTALERGRSPVVFEDGAQQRDFVHVQDVARANVLVLHADGDVTGPTTSPAARSTPCSTSPRRWPTTHRPLRRRTCRAPGVQATYATCSHRPPRRPSAWDSGHGPLRRRHRRVLDRTVALTRTRSRSASWSSGSGCRSVTWKTTIRSIRGRLPRRNRRGSRRRGRALPRNLPSPRSTAATPMPPSGSRSGSCTTTRWPRRSCKRSSSASGTTPSASTPAAARCVRSS